VLRCVVWQAVTFCLLGQAVRLLDTEHEATAM